MVLSPLFLTAMLDIKQFLFYYISCSSGQFIIYNLKHLVEITSLSE